MTTQEINFDGLIGPTHNYAGLSLGNVASEANAGDVASPRAAALQGLAKMGRLMALGLDQGFLPPPPRPAVAPLRRLGFSGTDTQVLAAAAKDDPALLRAACSASSMWAANAATVIAAPDSADGRVHLVTANLASMPHRALEAADTHAALRRVFFDETLFAVHPPLPFGRHFGDEGAANHMRLAPGHAAPGLNVFVHGEERGGRFPERQALRASQAVARITGAREALFVRQSAQAIRAGAFHNDVVAVANEMVLLVHPQAYDDAETVFAILRTRGVEILTVEGVSLADAVASYLFNSQLVTLADGSMALILPAEAKADAAVWRAVERLLASGGAIRRAEVVDLRESMRNGGGPACLRLRVVLSDAERAACAPGVFLDDALHGRLVGWVERHYRDRLSEPDLADAALLDEGRRALAELTDLLGLGAVYPFQLA